MTGIRLRLARWIAGGDFAVTRIRFEREPPPKRPTLLWLNRRAAMLQFGYDPRDTANP